MRSPPHSHACQPALHPPISVIMSELPSISFVEGFVKVCADRGFSPRQTAFLLDQALIQQDLKDPAFRMGMVEYAEKNANVLQKLLTGFNGLNPEVKYGLGGMAAGGVGGFLTGGKHKLRNALIGAGAGGLAGYGVGKWRGNVLKNRENVAEQDAIFPKTKLPEAKQPALLDAANKTPAADNPAAKLSPETFGPKSVDFGQTMKVDGKDAGPKILDPQTVASNARASEGRAADTAAAQATGRVQAQIDKAPAGVEGMRSAIQSDTAAAAAAQRAKDLFPGEKMPEVPSTSAVGAPPADDPAKIRGTELSATNPALTDPSAVAKGERETEQRALHPDSTSHIAQARIQRAFQIANDPNSSIEQIQEANAIIAPYRSTGGTVAGAAGAKDIVAAAGKGGLAPFKAVGEAPGVAAGKVVGAGKDLWEEAQQRQISISLATTQEQLKNTEAPLKAALRQVAAGHPEAQAEVTKLTGVRNGLTQRLQELTGGK